MYGMCNFSLWCEGYFFSPKTFVMLQNQIYTDCVKVSKGALMEFLDLYN